MSAVNHSLDDCDVTFIADELGDGVTFVPYTPSKSQRARDMSKKIKNKSKRFLHGRFHADGSADPSSGEASEDESDDVADIFSDPAFNPAILQEQHAETTSLMEDFKAADASHIVKTAASAIRHPKRTIRGKALRKTAAKISAKTDAYSPDHGSALLDAHNDLRRVELEVATSHSCSSASDGCEVEDAKVRVQKLEDYRDSLKTAWVLGRHVDRVRVVNPMSQKRRREDFMTQSDPTQPPRLQWDAWAAHLLLWYCRSFTAQYIDTFDRPPFDLADFTRIVERLAVVSEPWQAFFIRVRQVWMWTHPSLTIRCMVVFYVLWYFDHLFTWFFGWVLFITIRNRYNPDSIRTIRSSLGRAQDRSAKAQAWSELVQQHGNDEWIEPMLEKLGPMLQMELGDWTDLLEVMENFYCWARPNKTLATLFFVGVCFVICLAGDLRFFIRLTLFACGMIFFGSWPIKTRYPKYRNVVPCMRWIFWDIPTFAEMAIIRLQEKSIERDALLVDHEDTQSDSSYHSDPQIGATKGIDSQSIKVDRVRYRQRKTFRAVHDKSHGRLVVTRTGFWYHDQNQKIWVAFQNLIEIRKIDVQSKMEKFASLQLLPSGIQLFFQGTGPDASTDCLTLTVSQIERDQIFSLMLGWSNLKWQVLQLERDKPPDGDVSRIQKVIKRVII